MQTGPLQPYSRSEALTVKEAVARTGKKPQTIRSWCSLHGLGRHVGGQWAVSKVALHLFENARADALAAYLAGDRAHPGVIAAYQSEGVPLPSSAMGAGRE